MPPSCFLLGSVPSALLGSLCEQYLLYRLRSTFFCRQRLYGRYVTITSRIVRSGVIALSEVEVYSTRRGMISAASFTFVFS